MQVVTHLQRQAVLSGWQLHVDDVLPVAEMHPRRCTRNHRSRRQTVGVDRHVMMSEVRPRLLHLALRDGGNLELLGAELERHGTLHGCAVLRLNEEHARPFGGRLPARGERQQRREQRRGAHCWNSHSVAERIKTRRTAQAAFARAIFIALRKTEGAESRIVQWPIMLRFLTAGESHGQALVVTVDGMPAGLELDIDALNQQLRRRQGGYGRGRRMAIESDRAEILAGIRHARTTGAPIALLIRNRDWINWQQTMYVEPEMPEGASGARRAEVTRPRPGHADLAGALKYGHDDIRDVLERASARETAARVAAGSLGRQLLARFGIRIASHVSMIGDVALPDSRTVSFGEAAAIPDEAALRCADLEVQQRMIAVIDRARDAGDTVGGAFEIIATGVPPGLGSYVQWDRKLDGRLGQALMCIHAIKAVGIGIGPEAAIRPGSRVHDEILPPAADAGLPVRPTNNAGGLEGGVTNGEDIRVSGFMKPISTLMKPLRSVDLATMTTQPAAIERSDVCAVPAAAVVGEAMVAFVLADAFLEKFGGDSIDEIDRHYAVTAEQVRRRFSKRATPA